MADDVAMGTSECRLTVTPDPLRRLALQLAGLGPDFSVWEDLEVLPPAAPGERTKWGIPASYRPRRKDPVDWTWFDCHRSIHWGLAKWGVSPCDDFNRLLLPLADGVYAVLPAAAAVLDPSVVDDPGRLEPLLTILREDRCS